MYLLSFFVLLLSLFFQLSTYVQQRAGRGGRSGAGLNGTNAGGDSRAGQDRDAAWLEEEIERWAGGIRSREGGVGERGRSGD